MFVQRLKRLRAELGMTQKQLSDTLGCSAASVAHWESGTRTPSIDFIIILANLFDCSLEYIMGVSDYRHENEAIKYLLTQMVETGLVTPDGYIKQSTVDRFIGYIKALEQIPIK